MPGLAATFGVQHEWRQSPLWHVPRMLSELAASSSPRGFAKSWAGTRSVQWEHLDGTSTSRWHSGWLSASLKSQDIWGHRGPLLVSGGLQQLSWWWLSCVSPITVFQSLIYFAHGKGKAEMSARQLCYHKDGSSVRKKLKMILISAYLLQVMYAHFFF